MYQTNYHRPASLAEAEKLLSDDAALLAGGMTLLPTMKQRLASPSDLIDIGRLKELQGISEEGGTLAIGAGTKHFETATSDLVKRRIPALAKLAGLIGDPHVRHMGTMGGSVANADPAADYPSAVLALNATVVTNRGSHQGEDFFQGMFTTALEPGEIITRFLYPIPQRAGYQKFPNPASRYAMVGVFVADFGGGNIRVAVTGAAPSVFRQKEMEAKLKANFSPDAVAGVKQSPEGLNADIHGSAEYRAHLVTVMAKRAVAEILGVQA
jgi:carbon-monoxide dehydrogenase medium subunit